MKAWSHRWSQLTLAVFSTVMLANLQYGWTLFVDPMHDANHWSRAGIQLAFTIMIFVNTWLSPLEGWLVDRYGPRPVVMLGGILAAVSWSLNARAGSLQALYVSAVIGGLSIGCVFATSMGTALKWFPDKRGLAAGLIAAGYGLGAALTAAPLATMIRSSGYRHTFQAFGLFQGVTILVFGAMLIKPKPPEGWNAPGLRIRRGAELSPLQTVRTGVFWVIYLVYVLIAFGGMVMTAQLGPISRDLGVERQTVTLLGLSGPALTFAISIDNFANGITRPLSGFLSDMVGRENTMLFVFTLESAALVGMAVFGRNPYCFILFAALTFLFWGEIFVVFPAICGDAFGVNHATANNGLLYTAKGTAALTVPLANLLVSNTGTWTSVLVAAALCSLTAGVVAKFLVVPMREKLRKAATNAENLPVTSLP